MTIQATEDYGLLKHDAVYFRIQTSRFGGMACFHPQSGILSPIGKERPNIGSTEDENRGSGRDNAKRWHMRSCDKETRYVRITVLIV